MTLKGIHFDYPLIFYIVVYFGIIMGAFLTFKTIYQIHYIILDYRLKKDEYIRSSKLPAETYRQFYYSENYKKVRFIGKEKIFVKIK